MSNPAVPPASASSTLSLSSGELPPSGAERDAQRQLALAIERARERHARDIRREEQHDERGAEQHRQHRSRGAVSSCSSPVRR